MQGKHEHFQCNKMCISLKTVHIGKICFRCKVLVVGGGTGGCTMAAKFAHKFKDPNKVVIIEPNDVSLFSYYIHIYL